MSDYPEIHSLGLSTRTTNILLSEGLLRLDQLTALTRRQFQAVPGVGSHTAAEVHAALDERGLGFRWETPDERPPNPAQKWTRDMVKTLAIRRRDGAKYTELAREMGVSTERARQLVKKGVRAIVTDWQLANGWKIGPWGAWIYPDPVPPYPDEILRLYD